MDWSNILNGEALSSVRSKLNTLGSVVDNITKGKLLSTQRVLIAEFFTDQSPTGEGFDNAINMRFSDTAATADDGSIKVYPDGQIEVLSNLHDVELTFVAQVARSTSSGVAELYAWLESSGDGGATYAPVPYAHTFWIKLDDQQMASRHRDSFVVRKDTPVGTRLRVRFARSEAGPDQGSLVTHTPAAGFSVLPPVPSAWVEATVQKNGV